ncbi:MAG: DUF1365 domain-containing protein [Rhodoferax sp.]|nr:DUF1365 domain-containing protein [Rhodoferax sp.]MCF8209592.1 DUF1365 domain-containing protein [Rhodoferax sp.]
MSDPLVGSGCSERQTLAAPDGQPLDPLCGNGAVPLIGFGQVRHARMRPVSNAFVYGTYFLLLPMRSMRGKGAGALVVNRRAALSFFDVDHGDGRGPERGGALGWLEELLQREGLGGSAAQDCADGEIWLHCYPRVLGHTFKPVSFWYCHRRDGSLRAIVAEVNNTFGERHCYVLDAPRFGVEQRAAKVFHVSPFCPVEGSYRFRFMVTPDHRRTVACVDYDDAAGPLIKTSVSGTLEPVTAAAVRRALWRYPAMTLGVVLRIHWQAAKLFLKKTPFFVKPAPPATFTTR